MTKEMVKILFPATKNINEVVSIMDKYRDKFWLNTDLRMAMFLTQVREEIGSEKDIITKD